MLMDVFNWFLRSKDRNLELLSNEEDSVSQLSEKDVYLLQITWEIIRKDYRKHATRLFEILYEASPHVIERLPAFKNVPVDEIRNTKSALAHAVTTLSALDNLVINATDKGCLAALLLKFGRDHIKRRVYKSDFGDMPDGMSLFIKEAIGSAWNEQVGNAWMKFFKYVVHGSFDYLDNE